MGSVARAALSWALFSASLRAQYPDTLGLSVFLLVPVPVGDCDFSAAGNRVPKTEDLNTEGWQRDIHAATCRELERMRRTGSIPARRMV